MNTIQLTGRIAQEPAYRTTARFEPAGPHQPSARHVARLNTPPAFPPLSRSAGVSAGC